MNNIRTYKGCNIYPMGFNSWGGKWETYCDGTFISADTLRGIKRMISERLEKGTRYV